MQEIKGYTWEESYLVLLYSYTAHAAAWCSEAYQLHCNDMIMMYESVLSVSLLLMYLSFTLSAVSYRNVVNSVIVPSCASFSLCLLCQYSYNSFHGLYRVSSTSNGLTLSLCSILC